MSTSHLSLEQQSRTNRLGLVADYIELTKPKIAIMLLAAVAVSSFVAAKGYPDLLAMLHVVIGTALVAASSCVWNQWIERHVDMLMPRTASRPLPAGRIQPLSAVLFGTILGAVGVVYLAATVGWLTSGIGALTWFLYVCVYTPMKRTSPWNTAVGAVAGALPLWMGWLAMGKELDIRAVAIFAILFFWQFPHFMAIAWLYRKQYEKAGMKMWSVVDPTGRRAGVQAVSSAIALILVSVVPVILGQLDFTHILILISTAMLGFAQLLFAVNFYQKPTDTAARWLLWASLVYLPCMLGLLLLNHLA
ncbi:MAG: heme o synthase [Pirellulales bacterium]